MGKQPEELTIRPNWLANWHTTFYVVASPYNRCSDEDTSVCMHVSIGSFTISWNLVSIIICYHQLKICYHQLRSCCCYNQQRFCCNYLQLFYATLDLVAIIYVITSWDSVVVCLYFSFLTINLDLVAIFFLSSVKIMLLSPSVVTCNQTDTLILIVVLHTGG